MLGREANRENFEGKQPKNVQEIERQEKTVQTDFQNKREGQWRNSLLFAFEIVLLHQYERNETIFEILISGCQLMLFV